MGQAGSLKEADIEAILKRIPLTVGGGKVKVSLYDAIPSFAVQDLVKLVEEFGRR